MNTLHIPFILVWSSPMRSMIWPWIEDVHKDVQELYQVDERVIVYTNDGTTKAGIVDRKQHRFCVHIRYDESDGGGSGIHPVGRVVRMPKIHILHMKT